MPTRSALTHACSRSRSGGTERPRAQLGTRTLRWLVGRSVAAAWASVSTSAMSIRRCSRADRTAASTIDRLSTLLCSLAVEGVAARPQGRDELGE